MEIHGTTGDDIIVSGSGNDTICGSDGTDTITPNGGNNTVYGEGGDDTFLTGNAIAVDTFDGGSGENTVNYENAVGEVTASLTDLTGGVQGRFGIDYFVADNGISTIQDLVGSGQFDDQLTGDNQNNQLDGLGGRCSRP